MKNFVSLVAVVVLFVWSLALSFYTFYVPYKYFVDQHWLIENLGLLASLPIQWYVCWLIGEYGKKKVYKMVFDGIMLFVPKSRKLSVQKRNEIIMNALNKKPLFS